MKLRLGKWLLLAGLVMLIVGTQFEVSPASSVAGAAEVVIVYLGGTSCFVYPDARLEVATSADPDFPHAIIWKAINLTGQTTLSVVFSGPTPIDTAPTLSTGTPRAVTYVVPATPIQTYTYKINVANGGAPALCTIVDGAPLGVHVSK